MLAMYCFIAANTLCNATSLNKAVYAGGDLCLLDFREATVCPHVCKRGSSCVSMLPLYTACELTCKCTCVVLRVVQDVPVAALQQQRDKHFQETYNLRLSASAVRAQPLGQ
jgi:hypothetical protein